MSEEDKRNWQGALSALTGLREKVTQLMGDQEARRLFSEDLIKEVLRAAWRTQYEDQRGEFRKRVSEIVSDAIDDRKLGASKNETPKA